MIRSREFSSMTQQEGSLPTDAGRVSVLMGSESDLPVMRQAVDVLQQLGIEVEMEITSAHRTPERTREIADGAASRGVRVFIVGAGGAAHLAGVIAAHTSLPVLAVPLASTTLQGVDALLATVQMPAGIPVATLAIGAAGARNAALLAAEILALHNPDLTRRLQEDRRLKALDVAAASQRARRSMPGTLPAGSPPRN
ncbi:MAG: 5-(carboxyamino)imidazole ribonucleotide mutase [Acidobacteriota bacterium]